MCRPCEGSPDEPARLRAEGAQIAGNPGKNPPKSLQRQVLLKPTCAEHDVHVLNQLSHFHAPPTPTRTPSQLPATALLPVLVVPFGNISNPNVNTGMGFSRGGPKGGAWWPHLQGPQGGPGGPARRDGQFQSSK